MKNTDACRLSMTVRTQDAISHFRQSSRMMPETVLQPLSLSCSSFSTLRRAGMIYVDKTASICRMAAQKGKFLLVRPRRFGKSLLITTLDSLFRFGLRDFGGLAIEALWKDKTYAVVRLDFSTLRAFASEEQFERDLSSLILAAFEPLGFRYRSDAGISFIGQLKTWMLSLEDASLVLLIDEYDTPLTEHLDDPKALEHIQSSLGTFYAVLKQADACLRFAFMTGIAKLSSTGIFSGPGSFSDLSLDPAYGELLGFTEEEIQRVFLDYLSRAAWALGLPEDELLARLRLSYDGYSFDEKASAHVCSPWSVLNFLDRPDRGLKNYWYASAGKPTALMKYLSGHALDTPESYSEPKTVTLEALEATHRYDDIEPNVLLTHAGYLTLREVRSNGLVMLSYPNSEVARSMARLYAERLLSGNPLSAAECTEIEKALERGVLADAVQELSRVFQAVDYQNYPVSGEAACRAYIQVLLMGASLSPAIEVHSARGRSDLEVTAGGWHWVFEFKYAEKPGAVRRLLEEGLRQMRERAYGAAPRGKRLRRAVLVFSAESRSFAAWQEAEEEA